MRDEQHSDGQGTYRSGVPLVAGLLTALTGVLVLVGWAFDVPGLRSVLPGLVEMKANTALGLLAAGAGLVLLRADGRPGRRAGRGLAAAVIALGLLTLVEYLFGVGLGIDELVARDPRTPADAHPGRMAPATAAGFVLLGLALGLLDRPRRWGGGLAQPLALAVAVLNATVLVGHAYGAEPLYRFGHYTAVAVHTAAALLVLALGVLAARPRRGLMVLVTAPTLGGLAVRRQLPVAVLVLVAFGWVRVVGQDAGLYGNALGTALMVTASVLVFGVLIWTTGRALDRLDRGRRDAEAVVREQRELLRATVASIGDGVIATDGEGRVSFLNPVAQALTGWSAEDAAGVPLEAVFRIVNETTRQPVENPALRALKEGVIVGLANHTILIAKGGVERPIDDCAAPIRDDTAAVIGAVLVFRDITDRKKAEERVRASEERRRLALDSAELGGWNFDPAAGTLATDERFRAIYGVTSDVMTYEQAVAVIHPDDQARVRDAVAAGTRPDGPARYAVEYRVVRQDGAVRWVFAQGRANFDPADDRRLVSFDGTVTDVTDRKRGESLLADQNRVLQQMLRGGTLADVLEALCLTAEGQTAEGGIATVLLADGGGTLLRPAAGGRCPAAYSQAINPVPVGPACGSCGTAAYRGEPVVVADIATDPLWADYRHAALPHGLRACWSVPIPSSAGAVLGTFAVYSPAPRRPTDHDLRVMEFLARTAGLAIERRQADEAVREGRERLQAALDGSGSGTFRWNIQTNALDWDENLDRLFGLAPGKTIRSLETFVATVHSDDQPGVVERCRRCADQGVDFSMEFRVLWPDGSVHWLDDQGKTFRDDAGRPHYMTGMCRDITQRRRDEQALRDSEERFRTLFDTMDEGFVVIEIEFDPAGRATDYRHVEANPAFERHTGLKDHLGQSVRETVPGLEEFWFATYGRVAATGEPTRFEHRAEPLGDRWFDAYASRLGGLGSNRVAVLFTDITARKRAEQERERLVGQLREQDKRKDEFLATLAHELRNPLAPIRNGLQIIGLSGPNGAVEKARTMMSRQLTQLVRLVDDLLDVSRITRGKLDLRTERVDMRAVIDAAVETSRPLIDQAGHELAVAMPDEPTFVDGDATRLAQVVSNLLTNSAKYTHRGGHIRLTVRRNDGTVAVSVADDGIGIPPAMLDQVFVMFAQVDRTLEKTTGGLGIGLSLVKGLVEMHGGTIEARSEGEGRGSEFVVTLPIAVPVAGGPTATSEGAEEVVPSGRRRVLVVDDNADAANSLAQLLEMLGNEVRTAYDGEAGVRAAGEFRPAVVLCDLGMPVLNGYEAARRIRAEMWGKDMVLVALTGWGQEDDRRKTVEAGFNSHMVKPVEFAALTKLLAGLEVVKN